jgi:hypothetical protein
MDKILELLAKANAILVLENADLKDKLQALNDTLNILEKEIKFLKTRKYDEENTKQVPVAPPLVVPTPTPNPWVEPPFVSPPVVPTPNPWVEPPPPVWPHPWIEQTEIVAYGCPMERNRSSVSFFTPGIPIFNDNTGLITKSNSSRDPFQEKTNCTK